MNILFVSSESRPFAATGGLADVLGALPKAVKGRGTSCIRVMPYYTQFMERGKFKVKDTGKRLEIPLGFKHCFGEIWVHEDKAVKTYFIRRDEFFDRSQLYAERNRAYDDNNERFIFFQKAVAALIDILALDIDIVHCNDWQTGLIPLFMKHGVDGLGRKKIGQEKTVYTIHNLSFPGRFSGSDFGLTNLPFSCFTTDIMEFYGDMNFMKAGITVSDAVTTVSKSYAQEIQTEKYGCGLEGVLNDYPEKIQGIVNGIDYETWNPATDPFIENNYSSDNLGLKNDNKSALIKEMGLKGAKTRPCVGVITRLTKPKFELIERAIEKIMGLDLSMVVLGNGDEELETACRSWINKWPGRFQAKILFDADLSHRIYAGADMMLMPSEFEPCGLVQLIALKYGTVPIVHSTGGLKDTIKDIPANGKKGTGFKFETYASGKLVDSLERALRLYRDKPIWESIQKRAMAQDFSWQTSAKAYRKLYKSLS